MISNDIFPVKTMSKPSGIAILNTMNIIKITWKEYNKTLPLARKIYEKIYPRHKTHAEWANSFNIIGDINRILIKNKHDK